jgi:hypothetical protein
LLTHIPKELIPYIGGLFLIHENTTHTKLKIMAVGGPFSLKPMSCFDILPHVEMNTYFLGGGTTNVSSILSSCRLIACKNIHHYSNGAWVMVMSSQDSTQ